MKVWAVKDENVATRSCHGLSACCISSPNIAVWIIVTGVFTVRPKLAFKLHLER
jgi:hypothetical protein